MATPAFIDVTALLEPIPGDRPAGASVQFTLSPQLDELRREVTPEEAGNDEPKRADWAGVVRLTERALREESKDLLLAARLTEALVRLHAPTRKSFAALRDGLQLLRLLVEQCWDRILPEIEEPDDLERRGSAFTWLNNPERGVRFPTTLRLLPLLEGREATLSYQDWKDSANPEPGRPTAGDVEAILSATDPAALQQLAEDANESLNELYALSTVLDEKMGSVAPTLLDLRTAVEQCVGLIQDFAARRRPELEAFGDSTGEGGTTAPGEAGASGPTSSRAEVYAQLRRASARLRALEPHSPVPYLIDRAVELGDLPFHLMIRQLVRDANALAELNRDLGIRDGGAPTPSES
jgi:type VI secretion system protein ImpA